MHCLRSDAGGIKYGGLTKQKISAFYISFTRWILLTKAFYGLMEITKCINGENNCLKKNSLRNYAKTDMIIKIRCSTLLVRFSEKIIYS